MGVSLSAAWGTASLWPRKAVEPLALSPRDFALNGDAAWPPDRLGRSILGGTRTWNEGAGRRAQLRGLRSGVTGRKAGSEGPGKDSCGAGARSTPVRNPRGRSKTAAESEVTLRSPGRRKGGRFCQQVAGLHVLGRSSETRPWSL